MPRKTKTTASADKAAQPQFSAELLEQLIPGPVTPAELEGIFQQFKKSVLERALGAEMSHHLGYAPGQAKPEGAAANHRNGKSAKTVLTDVGALRIDVPRDREGTFEPQLIGKHERRFTGFNDLDLRHVRTRHDGARDPGLPGRDVLGRCLARSHQQRHRRGDERGLGLADAPARAHVPRRVLRRAAGQDT